MAFPKPQTRYCFADYRAWPDEARWELIDGAAWSMAPAPDWPHQALVMTLGTLLSNALKGGPCRVLPAPLDVLLPKGDEVDDAVETLVQPDLVVICNPAKLGRHGIRGAPDWVIEVLSPATARKDQGVKRDLYERHGVAEYWILSPWDRLLWVYVLEAGAYGKPALYEEGMRVTPQGFPDLSLSLSELFADIPPGV